MNLRRIPVILFDSLLMGAVLVWLCVVFPLAVLVGVREWRGWRRARRLYRWAS